jgi:Fe-S cluster biosynthesis and repair protein YggX
MISQIIKQKINKIDFDLKELFEEVLITEKSKKVNYFEIKAKSTFLIERYNYKNLEVVIEINSHDLAQDYIKWVYLANPLKESNSDRIERVSNISTIANDIFELVSKKRMSREYFESVEDYVELINENNLNIEDTSDKGKILKVLEGNNIKVLNEKDLSFEYNGNLKISERLKIESQLKSITSVNEVFINNNKIFVNLK